MHAYAGVNLYALVGDRGTHATRCERRRRGILSRWMDYAGGRAQSVETHLAMLTFFDSLVTMNW